MPNNDIRNYSLNLHVIVYSEMNTKLTLNLNKQVIESAKEYAESHQTSLSRLIENYLSSLTKKEKKETKVSPLVESLTGILPDEPENDYKEGYYQYLNKKYS